MGEHGLNGSRGSKRGPYLTLNRPTPNPSREGSRTGRAHNAVPLLGGGKGWVHGIKARIVCSEKSHPGPCHEPDIGRDIALRRPRRRAQRQATESVCVRTSNCVCSALHFVSGGDIAARCPYQHHLTLRSVVRTARRAVPTRDAGGIALSQGVAPGNQVTPFCNLSAPFRCWLSSARCLPSPKRSHLIPACC